jgi:hypothetical protein
LRTKPGYLRILLRDRSVLFNDHSFNLCVFFSNYGLPFGAFFEGAFTPRIGQRRRFVVPRILFGRSPSVDVVS